MKIAVDAMGGDFAPKAIVEGVMLAQKNHPEIEFLYQRSWRIYDLKLRLIF